MMIGTGLGMVDRDIEVGKEYKVGTFTLNGVTYDRYVKIIDFGQLPSGNPVTKSVPHGISNASGFLSIQGITQNSTGIVVPIPYAHHSSMSYQIALMINNDNVSVYTTYDYTAYTKTYIIIEYYK